MRNGIDNAYTYFAADSLLKRLRKLVKRIPDVRRQTDESDIEPVHKMRVAARRLRAALTVFKEPLPTKQRKQWQKMIKSVRSSLGTARDLDVQIEFLRKFIARTSAGGSPEDLNELLQWLRARREQVRPQLAKTMDELEDDPTLQHMEITLRILRTSAKKKLPTRSPFSSPTYDGARLLAGRKILKRIEKFLAFEPFVVMPDAQEKHHKMRIAGKKLRYTMEIFNSLWGRRLTKPINRMKKYQDLLGDRQDCVVWLKLLGEFSSEYDREMADGVESLHQDCANRYKMLYDEFHKFHRTLQRRNFWEYLHGILLADSDSPPQDEQNRTNAVIEGAGR